MLIKSSLMNINKWRTDGYNYRGRFFRYKSYASFRWLVIVCFYAWVTKLELKNKSKNYVNVFLRNKACKEFGSVVYTGDEAYLLHIWRSIEGVFINELLPWESEAQPCEGYLRDYTVLASKLFHPSEGKVGVSIHHLPFFLSWELPLERC